MPVDLFVTVIYQITDVLIRRELFLRQKDRTFSNRLVLVYYRRSVRR